MYSEKEYNKFTIVKVHFCPELLRVSMCLTLHKCMNANHARTRVWQVLTLHSTSQSGRGKQTKMDTEKLNKCFNDAS